MTLANGAQTIIDEFVSLPPSRGGASAPSLVMLLTLTATRVRVLTSSARVESTCSCALRTT